MKKEFDIKELESCGEFLTLETPYGNPWPAVEKLNTPVTPRENFLLFLDKKPFYWVPDLLLDANWIMPNMIPDNLACGFSGGLDNFGVKWIADESCPELPAFVEPGFKLIDDIQDWEKLSWPEIDSWDWEETAKDYVENHDNGRLNIAIMQFSAWERIIAIMRFEEAAVSLIADPENTHAFFDRLLEVNLKMIENMKEYFDCDAVYVHDDWGAQRSPFFSGAMLDEFLISHHRKLAEKAHSLGVEYILHSCGNITSFVPYMIDAGIDMWEFNFEAVRETIEETIKKYGDQIRFSGPFGFVDPLPTDDEENKKAIEEIYKKYASTGACAISNTDQTPHDYDMRRYCYELARKTANAIF